MRCLFITCMVLIFSNSYGYQYWNDIRYSALLPDDNITIRVENPSGSGIQNYIIYEVSGIQEELMVPITDGPSTLSATVPGPFSIIRNYGFRLLGAAVGLHLIPIPIPDGIDPEPDDLTLFVTDPSGDEVFGYSNLDLVECRFSFSDTRLFASLTNAGGGFPVSQGLTFFGYLFGITDPDVADPDTVFALLYTVDQPGIMSPGLYKITGTGFGDLEKIGDLEFELFPADNAILLSCELSDLLADPDFSSWFDVSDPALAVAGFTQRITLLGGAQESDLTSGGSCYLREFSISPSINHFPTISDPLFEGSGALATASLNYSDQDGNCPVLSEVRFDGGDPYPLYPLTLDYESTVTYRTEAGIEPLGTGSWNSAVFRFSDDLVNVVELQTFNTGISGGGLQYGFGLSVYPNPTPLGARIVFSMPVTGHVSAGVYDARGVLVSELFDGQMESGPSELTWNGSCYSGDDLPPGLYFFRLQTLGATGTHPLILLR